MTTRCLSSENIRFLSGVSLKLHPQVEHASEPESQKEREAWGRKQRGANEKAKEVLGNPQQGSPENSDEQKSKQHLSDGFSGWKRGKKKAKLDIGGSFSNTSHASGSYSSGNSAKVRWWIFHHRPSQYIS